MTLDIEKSLLIGVLSGNMIPNSNVELSILKKYSLERKDGIDFVRLLEDNFLDEMFQDRNINIYSMFKYNTIISKTYKLLESIDLILLSKVTDYNFKDIVYKKESESTFYFEVIYEDNQTI